MDVAVEQYARRSADLKTDDLLGVYNGELSTLKSGYSDLPLRRSLAQNSEETSVLWGIPRWCMSIDEAVKVCASGSEEIPAGTVRVTIDWVKID